MYELQKLISDLISKHCHKFDYLSTGNLEICIIFHKCLCGEIDEETFQLKSLLEKSLQDGIDYLPEKYHYNAKDLMGDINADLIN